MDAELRPLDPLLQQWRELPAGDRKNILGRLPAEQRLAFQRVLAASERESAEVTARTQRFRTCSPWLAELVDACEKGGAAAASIKPAARAALLDGYEKATLGGEEPEAPLSLTALAQSVFRSMKERL